MRDRERTDRRHELPFVAYGFQDTRTCAAAFIGRCMAEYLEDGICVRLGGELSCETTQRLAVDR